MPSEIRLAVTALTRRIVAGRLNKARDGFIGGGQNVTGDALKAIIDYVEPNHTVTVNVDGKPKYEINVREIPHAE